MKLANSAHVKNLEDCTSIREALRLLDADKPKRETKKVDKELRNQEASMLKPITQKTYSWAKAVEVIVTNDIGKGFPVTGWVYDSMIRPRGKRELIESALGRSLPDAQEKLSIDDPFVIEISNTVKILIASELPKTVLHSIKEETDDEVSLLPKTAKIKLEKTIEKATQVRFAEMNLEFEKQLADAIKKKTAELDRLIKDAKLDRQLAKAERDAAIEYRKGIDSHMTMDEFKLVRGCLHPDRQPDDMKDRFGRAFDIFTRLEKTVNNHLPISELKKRGWASVSPFAKRSA